MKFGVKVVLRFKNEWFYLWTYYDFVYIRSSDPV